MKVQCPQCHKFYNISDDALPEGKEIAFHCKECNGLVKIDLRSKPKKSIFPRMSKASKYRKQKRPSPTNESAESQPKGRALKRKIVQILMGRLPVMPQIVLKAQEVMADPNSSMKELARIIETDQGIVTRTLLLANSAYYGLAGKVTSVQHASVLLGNETLGEIIVMAGTSGFLNKTLTGYGVDSKAFWRHSLAVAFGSKLIAGKVHPELENDAFVAGLIHDSGKIMLDQHIFERKASFEEFMRDGQQSFLRAEKEILGFDHSEIGSEVCKTWGIPESLTIAVKYHHKPSLSGDNLLAYIVHVANFLALMHDFGTGFDEDLYPIEEGATEFLGLEQGYEDEIVNETHESVERIGEELGEA
jgi:HD-like signal output (HDOD) protein